MWFWAYCLTVSVGLTGLGLELCFSFYILFNCTLRAQALGRLALAISQSLATSLYALIAQGSAPSLMLGS